MNIRDDERNALHDLYTATHGKHWKWAGRAGRWNFSDPLVNPCETNLTWQGITCASSGKSLYYVTAINLTDYNIAGSIPASLSNLTGMQELIFNANRLTGSIPSSLRALGNLTIFSFLNNKLQGHVPCWFFGIDLPLLQVIDLAVNQFTGTLCDVTEGVESQLFTMRLSGNNLTGTLPSSWQNLTQLNSLYISNNLLTGSLPPHWATLSRLQSLYLSSNRLIGSIPFEYGSMSSLTYLQLSDNRLTGTAPSSLSNLTELTILDLRDNFLGGSLESCFNAATQTKLRTVDVSNNQFRGTIPEELYSMRSLKTIAAVSNCFDQSITPAICRSPGLENLVLDGLQSAAACRRYLLPGLSESYEVKHPFHGSLPACVFSMASLLVLHLSGNRLTGSIPADVTVNPPMLDLSLSHNQLTGPIPLALQQHDWMKLDLSNNFFDGILHSDFGSDYFNYTRYFLDRVAEANITFSDRYSYEAFRQSITNLTCPLIAIDPQNNYEVSCLDVTDRTYSMNQNRLSGNIPGFFQHQEDVRVLFGNSFDCRLDRSDLPRHDPYNAGYVCGSEMFDMVYYLWLSLAAVLAAVVAVMWYYWTLPSLDGPQQQQQHNSIRSFLLSLPSWSIARHLQHRSDDMLRLQLYTDYFQQYMQLCGYTCQCALFSVLVLSPIYLVLNVFYQTHEHQYAYALSIMYLAGPVPAAVLMTVLLLMLAAVRYYVVAYVIDNPYFKNELLQEEEEDGERERQREREVRCDSVEDAVRDSDASESFRGSMAFVRFTAVVVVEEVRRTALTLVTVDFRRTTYLYSVVFSINAAVMLLLNFAFVYVSLYESSSVIVLAQMLQPALKLSWDLFLPTLIRFFADRLWHTPLHSRELDLSQVRAKVVLLLLFLMVINSIAMPCLVVLVVSPNCFYNFFVPASSVTSTYPLVECSVYDSNGECLVSVLQLYSTSYAPPFRYSYQCADEIVSKYAPSQVYQCMLLTFAYPLSVLAAIHVFKQYSSDSLLFRTVHAIYPSALLKTAAGGGGTSSRQAVVKVQDAAVGGSSPDNSIPSACKDATINGRALSGVTSTADDDHEMGKKGSTSSSSSSAVEETAAVFDASLEIVYFLSLTGSMLTFGVVFPPLAAALLLAVTSLWCISRHMCDRFLLEALSARRLVEVDKLTHDCRGALNRSMILNSFWVIICCSACFYSLFLFDMLGDSMGYKQAYWIIIVTALSPLCLYAVEAACRRGRRRYAKWKGTQQNSTDTAGIGVIAVELSTAQSPLPMPS
jgi:Leucine-rich repeat (LRR) protein